MKKRILSILLATTMVLSMFSMSMTASAAEADRPYRCGDVDGNGVITIADALEILKYLAKMSTPIPTNARASKAARFASKGDVPTVGDALEILKNLAKMKSYFTTANCYCAWCNAGDNITIDTASLPMGTKNSAYSPVKLAASGGTGIKWTLESGSLPVGLNLADDGTISGTPTTVGTATFTVKAATDSGNATKQLSIEIVDVGQTTTTTSMSVPTGTTSLSLTTTTSYGQITTTTSSGQTTTPPNSTTTTATVTSGETTTAGTTSPGETTTAATVTTGTTSPGETTTASTGVTTTASTGVTTTASTGVTTTASTGATTTGTSAGTTAGTNTTSSGVTTTTPAATTTPRTTTTPGETTPKPPPANLTFSHKSGLYTGPFELEVTAPDGAEIWYTFSSSSALATENVLSGCSFSWYGALPNNFINRHDGGVTPTRGAPSLRLENGGKINVLLPRARTAFTVSAIMVLDGVVSEPVTRSFVRGPAGADLQYWADNDFMVVVLYSDARGIFSFNDGIFVDGLDRDQWEDEYIRLNSGITKARIRSEMDSHITQGNYPPTLPANFTRRGKGGAEVPVNLEIIDPLTNSRRINQRAGMRIKGGWSRGTFILEQKTFEIYCRNSYGDRGNVLYPLFGNINSYDGTGNLMHRFERFRLRNGATDREQCYMRDEMATELAEQSGFLSVQNHRPAVVFLNGAYYGLVWLKNPRTDDHWRRQYGGDANSVEIVGTNERGSSGCGRNCCGRAIPNGPGGSPVGGRTMPTNCTEATAATCPRTDCEDYWSSYSKVCRELGYCRATHRTFTASTASAPIAGSGSWEEVVRLAVGTSMTASRIPSEDIASANGLTNDANWARFQQIVDVDNLMHYYALNMYGANCDWPSNNMEMWRYYPTAEELAEVAAGKAHPHLDGKWRYVGYDLEYGWGLWQKGEPLPSASAASCNTIWALMNRPGASVRTELGGKSHFNATTASFMMPAILKRPEMRAKLANAYSDIIEGSHASTNALRVFESVKKKIEVEHRAMLGGPTRRISELPRNGRASGQTNPWPDAAAIYTTPEDGYGSKAISEFLTARPAAVQGHIQASLGLSWSSRYAVSVTVGNGGEAVLNTRPVGKLGLPTTDPRSARTVTGRYFTGVSVPITAIPWPGFRVANVTGATRVGTTNVWTVDAAATVNITFERDPSAFPLEIVAVKIKDQDEYIEIRNNSTSAVSTAGYFLTDDGGSKNSGNLTKWPFDVMSIPAGGTVKIGSRSNVNVADFDAITNFNMGFGERLRLTNGTETLQLVELSRVTREQAQVRGLDGNWRIEGERHEFVPPYNGNEGEVPKGTPGITVAIASDQGHTISFRITNNTGAVIGNHENPWVAVLEIPGERIATGNIWGVEVNVVEGLGTSLLVVEAKCDNQYYLPGQMAPGASVTLNVGGIQNG